MSELIKQDAFATECDHSNDGTGGGAQRTVTSCTTTGRRELIKVSRCAVGPSSDEKRRQPRNASEAEEAERAMHFGATKGAITSNIKHAIKRKTGPAKLAQLISVLF